MYDNTLKLENLSKIRKTQQTHLISQENRLLCKWYISKCRLDIREIKSPTTAVRNLRITSFIERVKFLNPPSR